MSSDPTAAELLDGQEPAFRVDGVGYRWHDVFRHARRRGDWQVLVTEVRQAHACLAAGDPQGSLQDRTAERALAVAFRTARGLHAAEDVEAWLAARGLTVRQWRRYVRGEALRRRHAAVLDTVVDRYRIDDDTVRAALPVWGWCTGAFPRWSGTLAERAAAARAVGDRDGVHATAVPDDLDALEDRFDRFAAAIASSDRLTELVSSRYLDWLRVECETAVFADPDTAAEALLCIRDDGWSLADAVRAAGARLRRHAPLVEEVGDDARPHLVRARDGDLLGPLPLAGQPALVHVLRKQAPTLDDDEIRLRATRELVTAAVSREVDDRVEWLHPR